MRWYVSYPILAAGLALGLDVLYPDAPSVRRADAEVQAQEDPASEPIVMTASDINSLSAASRVAQFSPGAELLAAELPSRPSSVLDYLAQTLTPASENPTPPPQPVNVAAWKGTIIRDGQASTAVAARPKEPLSRLALARDIQRELQRVGCYLGDIDGVWGGGSRRAVLVFMDRVNASLPTQEPDVFMLSLLKSQTASVCGESCPRGQSLTASGRCLPSTLVAQAGKAGPSPAPTDDAWGAVVAEAPPASHGTVPFGRMSIGGPKPDDVAELSSGWSQATSTQKSIPPLARTAALDEAESGSTDPAANAAVSSFDTDVAPAPPTVKRSKPSGSRGKAERPRRTSTTRHVQRLFTHPLGSM